MRVFGKRLQVADAVVAGAGFESVAERQRTKCRVAPRAAAADRQAFVVSFATLGEIARAADADLGVDDTPFVIESFSVGAAIAGTAAVIHVENGDAAAGPILNRIFQRRRARRC